jgi:acetate kinase
LAVAWIMRILVLNGGSSSFKCWFSDLSDESLPVKGPQPLWSARVDWSHHSGVAEIHIRRSDGAASDRSMQVDGPVAVLRPVIESLWEGSAKVISARSEIDVVCHRIVHGGPNLRESTPLTPEVRSTIAKQVEFAPAHNRFELEAIRSVDEVVGAGVLQIATFDTGFHSTLEPAAYVYPGPYQWLDQGVRRYGFHGISHRYAAHRAAELLDADSPRLITCHLGNGASLAAVRDGKSVDTTMGFTPIEGLMMGTRCGSIDPGILIYLIRHCGYSAEQLDRILNQESGLLGVSGLSGDMREILEAMQGGNERARLAFDVYTHRLIREVGAMLAVLGGVDAIVFTGGVGENCAPLRARVCDRLRFAGVRLDPAKNAQPTLDTDIAASDSPARVLVIRAEEEWEIARECYHLANALRVPSV